MHFSNSATNESLGELGRFSIKKSLRKAFRPLRPLQRLVKKDPIFRAVKKFDKQIKGEVARSKYAQAVIYGAGVVFAPFTGGASLAVASAAVQSSKAAKKGRSFGAQFAQGLGAGAIGWVAGAGIAYVAGSAGVGSGVFGSTPSAGAISAAASDAGMLYAPAASVVGTSATTAVSSGFSAAGLLKSIAGYVGQAKDIYGVVNAVRGARQGVSSGGYDPGGYGPASGGGYDPGSDGRTGPGPGGGRSDQGSSFSDEAAAAVTSLTTGRTPYYIGAGALAIFLLASLNKRSGMKK